MSYVHDTMNALITYLLTFVAMFWPAAKHSRYREREVEAIAADVATTDASPWEALRLMNIAALESTFYRAAVGSHGERGAWQIMPPASSYGAKEALRRMRVQGMAGFCGCVRPGRRANGDECPEMVSHRIDKADLFYFAFDPPREPT